MRYTQRELRRFVILDTIADIRAAERDGLPDYAEKCRRDLAALLPHRHEDGGIDRYGWPVELKGA